MAASSVGATTAGLPFGRTAVGINQGVAGGLLSGTFGGFGFLGWAVAFLVLFFIGFVFYRVWGTIGPLVGGAGFFW